MFISDNTKAILLLTAPLLLGKNNNDVKLLSSKEYHQLAIYLKNINKQPADLLGLDLDNILNGYKKLEYIRIDKLLQRGFLLSQALDYWYTRNMWVISRADKTYPNRLKSRLGEQAPPILYGCGDVNLLNQGGLAIVGSRNIDNDLIDYTNNIAQLTAEAGKMVVSGGARGVDSAAMQGALQAGGVACGVLAEGLEKAALNANNRLVFQENRLILVSACDPKSRFLVGNAMQRNKYIYALADAGLIVNSDFNKGGTWAGAVEQLDKYRQIPIYIRSTGVTSKGLEALRDKGAQLWTNPNSPIEFSDILVEQLPRIETHTQKDLFPNIDTIETKQNFDQTPEQKLFIFVAELIKNNLNEPKKEKELALLLGVSTAQIKLWLNRLVDEGVIIRQGRVARYALSPRCQNLDLFSGEMIQ
ncbi:DNA-processing protein DprA [Ursidibacter arcticus]